MTDESEAEATEAEPTEPEAESAETDAADGTTDAEEAPASDAKADAEVAAEDSDVKTAVATEETEEVEEAEEAPADEAEPEAETTDVVAEVTVTSTVTPVGNGKRFGAFLLDLLLAVVTAGIGWLVWSLFTWRNGQSPAKSLLGLRVVKLDTGRGATWGTMFLREVVGKWILGVVPFYTLVSAVLIALNTLGNAQGLWDKVAGTTVVEDPDGNLVR